MARLLETKTNQVKACVVMVHCVYGIFHLSRKAGRRTPASSAAYQLFSAFSDLCVLPLYTYGVMSTRSSSSTWTTLLSDSSLLSYLISAFYWGLVGAAGLHFLTLLLASWLSYQFRQITLMPPDMNPLEDNLTSRAKHRRTKTASSTNSSSMTAYEKRLSTPLEDRHRSGDPYQTVNRPPSVPFAHTRTKSEVSSRTRDSRLDLPSRQYQMTPGNSPRNSVVSEFSPMQRMSAPPPPRHAAQSRGSYMEIPLHETNASSRGSVGSVGSQVTITSAGPAAAQQQPRSAKFTEAWYASDSLVDRTQQRNRAVNSLVLNAAGKRRDYDAVRQRGYAAGDDDDDYDSDPEPYTGNENYDPADLGDSAHPNPLRSNPHAHPLAPSPPPKATPPRPKTPYRRPGTPGAALGELSLNDRRVSGSTDIADAAPPAFAARDGDVSDVSDDDNDERRPSPAATGPAPRRNATRLVRDLSKRMTWAGMGGAPKMRNSSIQAEGDFYSKPYGELKSATPPVMQTVGTGRQVSSGNDYDVSGGGAGAVFGRRAVSGKMAEEGRVNVRELVSRYAVLNE